MKKPTKRRLRLTIDFNDHTVFRITVKERNRERKYVRLERPWDIKVLKGLKLAKKAAALISQGVADLDEVRTAATSPRRRKTAKKPRVEELGVRRIRGNGPNRGIEW